MGNAQPVASKTSQTSGHGAGSSMCLISNHYQAFPGALPLPSTHSEPYLPQNIKDLETSTSSLKRKRNPDLIRFWMSTATHVTWTTRACCSHFPKWFPFLLHDNKKRRKEIPCQGLHSALSLKIAIILSQLCQYQSVGPA